MPYPDVSFINWFYTRILNNILVDSYFKLHYHRLGMAYAHICWCQEPHWELDLSKLGLGKEQRGSGEIVDPQGKISRSEVWGETAVVERAKNSPSELRGRKSTSPKAEARSWAFPATGLQSECVHTFVILGKSIPSLSNLVCLPRWIKLHQVSHFLPDLTSLYAAPPFSTNQQVGVGLHEGQPSLAISAGGSSHHLDFSPSGWWLPPLQAERPRPQQHFIFHRFFFSLAVPCKIVETDIFHSVCGNCCFLQLLQKSRNRYLSRSLWIFVPVASYFELK